MLGVHTSQLYTICLHVIRSKFSRIKWTIGDYYTQEDRMFPINMVFMIFHSIMAFSHHINRLKCCYT